MNARLYRSADDRIFAGVAGGLAEYWDADPSLIRIVWAMLVLLSGGIALLVYIVMAMVVPLSPEADATTTGTAGAASNAASRREARRAARAARREARDRSENTAPAIVFGVVLVVIGGVLFVREYLPQISLDWAWPMILIAVGVVVLVAGLTRGSGSGTGVGHSS